MLAMRIALRFLKSSKTQTVLIVLGLAIGIAVQVFVGSLLQNLQDGFLESSIGDASHVTILPGENETFIEDWQVTLTEAEGVEDVTAVSPAADSPSLLTYGNSSKSVIIRGLDLPRAESIYEFGEKTYEGALPGNESQILLGKELVEGLGIGMGDSVQIITPAQVTEVFWVSGFYDLGTAVINEQWAVVQLSASQSLFSMGGNITSIESQVVSIFTADEVASDVESAISGNNPGLRVENWKDNNEDFFGALNSQAASSYMIQTFVLMSVVIGIASVLSISVVQKSRQIGILKAMGIKDRQSSLIFMYQGLFLGIGGAVAGVSLGAGLFFGFLQGIKASGNTIFEQASMDTNFIILSAMIAIISAMFASLLPALKSRKLDPIEVIRNG